MIFDLKKQLNEYHPENNQEKSDKKLLLNLLSKEKNIFTRENIFFHFTASSWIVNQNRDKVLMIYHNIYDSWSWTGGHADGNENLLEVAINEAKEETGLKEIKVLLKSIFSIEILNVNGHMKKGQYILEHLHLNVTYLLEANDKDELNMKLDENSGVKWVKIDDIDKICKEDHMNIIYKKLNKKLQKYLRS
ncbi:NUDIX hydrolase [Cetobacterium somerae]|uniref:NUDIX hydrolase n=1 Tax=Cetobacterium sp. NK01 TaxID=2993530 RepID=UPI002115E7F4|nr:NUDIX hydrolase [Cetobacterium sp. NK01]MCQ8213589.1 NUDIX hydrolase [Cetobacterium sp. NK01]